MRTEYQCAAGGNVGQVFDKDGAFGLEIFNDKFVMHDFMTYIDRRAEFKKRELDDFDGAVDTGAKAARIGEKDFHIAIIR